MNTYVSTHVCMCVWYCDTVVQDPEIIQNWFPILALMLDGYVTLEKLLCLPDFIISFAKERYI